MSKHTCVHTHTHTHTKLIIPTVVKDVKQLELAYISGGETKWYCHLRNGLVAFYKYTLRFNLAILLLCIYPWERNTYVHINVYRNFIHDHTELETPWMTFNWWMNKQTRIYPGNAVLLSSRKKRTSLDIQQHAWISMYYEKEARLKKLPFLGFPGGAVVENLPANAGDTGSSPGLGRSHMPRSD